jgi:uncharacterized membrane protein YkvA (DUF1232 family)
MPVMQYSHVVALLSESGLSPEGVAERLCISNSTYRRWFKASARDTLPETYHANVAGAVYKLLEERLLSYDSERVNNFLNNNVPGFFQAAISGLRVTPDALCEEVPHQDKITGVLAHLGSSVDIRKQVDNSSLAIQAFENLGEAWKQCVKPLTKIIKNKQITLVDKLVAYGALFYLIFPFDLVPDLLPAFGYVDDFGILGFAAAFYARTVSGVHAKTAAG